MITLDNKLQSKNLLKRNDSSLKPQIPAKSPSFGGAMDLVTAGMQLCEQIPMLNVTVLDVATCIGPRTIVDTKTNVHAGLETLRRESSGLLFNCIFPSLFVMGVAGLLKHFALPEKYRHLGMAGSWANENSITELAKHFKNKGSKTESVNSYVKSVLSGIEGFTGEEGKNWKSYTKAKRFDEACRKISDAILSESISKKEQKAAVSDAFKILTEDVKAVQTIRVKGQDKALTGIKLGDFLRDTLDMGRKFSDKSVINNIDDFTKSAIKFVNKKSILGLCIVIPICMSLQAINRYITRKKSGIAGAPIYKDFGQEQTADGKSFGAKEKKVKSSKENLFLHKLMGMAVIAGVAIASMGKMPNKKMLQFNGIFPTMDQARFISGATFMSRIFAAEDNNEVRESTVRDSVGFAGLYFLGDYGGKLAAQIMEKVNPDIKLFNRKELPDKNAGAWKRLKLWVKEYDLKNFDELPKHLKNYRTICELSKLGVSLAILGLLIPIWNRKTTEKNREKELLAIQEGHIKDTVKTDREKLKQNTILHIWDSMTYHESNTFGKFEQMTFKGAAIHKG